MSGFRRFEPSTVTGPRLEKLAIVSEFDVAATENDASQIAGASEIVEQAGPLFPAANTAAIPAERRFSTIVFKTLGSVQPSLGGQAQELLITFAARSGRGLA